MNRSIVIVVVVVFLCFSATVAEERVVYTIHPMEETQYPAATTTTHDLILSTHETIDIRYRLEEKIILKFGIEQWKPVEGTRSYVMVIDGTQVETMPITLRKGEHSLYLVDENGEKVKYSERTIKIVDHGSSVPSFALALVYFGIGLAIVYRRKIKK